MEVNGHIPDAALTYVLGFSGGKDSVATWLYLTRTLQLPNVICLFSDTGHESPVLHDYLSMLETEHGCQLVRVQPILEDFRGELVSEKIRERIGFDGTDEELWKLPLDMERLSILKRRFPSTMVRFCTTHLKLYPMRRWLRANFSDVTNVVKVSGVRAEESPARAKHETWKFDDFMGCRHWLPLHKWTHDEVFAAHRVYGVPPNPLYLNGMSRVGCFPCIMARKEELVQIAKRYPEAFDRLSAMEGRVAAAVGKPVLSFFSPQKTPERFCSETCPNTGKPFPNAQDVKRWALADDDSTTGQRLLFQEDATEDGHACTSRYGLCE